ncbi:tRNA 2-thiouridine(34) synthase MnmA [Lutispora saccharofermentans]|uniref:tRNA-specific 2-thiouridylase MnmA n=1 Tax=Lutispora saccharofermentans TaxID=3024236 RepID=A0ABT1NEW0_9FIRM|nr:tRNA 2-thiouridine(34) synthase MnmA [Lutispora saccharofermentans]MCQ1529777.1 tRNA 2-thiouridine(34) synthase MnmA [Lutispora saccharofermentans]
MKERVIIGMSGGVDSSVAAYLLKEQGYDVVGVTMKLRSNEDFEKDSGRDNCCSLSAVDDARRVCNKLGIPFYVMNFTEIFDQKVVNYFIDEYFKGRTPNPCIACNKYVKFDALLRKAEALEAKYVATGHYARIMHDENLGRYLIKKSATAAKDQTYVLYNLLQNQLEHILMPLGDYTKEETRRIAAELDLEVADKPDSQEICFVEDNDYGKFLEQKRGQHIKPGKFLDTKGNVLGTHKGIVYYTVGQRKGLGIALGKPMFVVDIIAEKNQVILGEESEVFKDELIAINTNFLPFDRLQNPMRVKAKIRYSAKESSAWAMPIAENRIKLIFDEAQRAITPGQAVVFYQDDYLIGGGVILK